MTNIFEISILEYPSKVSTMTANLCPAICTGHMANSEDISVSQIKAVRSVISVVWAGSQQLQGGQQGCWKSDRKFD